MSSSRGKRVLMLVENNPFPNDPRIRREARALIDAGYQVSVVAPARPWPAAARDLRWYSGLPFPCT